MGKKYLVKDIEWLENPKKIETDRDSYYMQRSCTASYSTDIGTAILDKLPHYLKDKGNCTHMVITSQDPEFQIILSSSMGKLEKKLKDIMLRIKEKEIQRNKLLNELYDNKEERFGILKAEIYSHSNIISVEKQIDDLNYKKRIVELNYKIISDVLKTGDSQSLKKIDEDYKKANEALIKFCKD